MSDDKFDLLVIGGGPGGYVAAIRAAQLGLKVACVDKRDALGGTCLNVGCIPSKALLHASELYEQAEKHLPDFGITVGELKLDLKKMLARKDKTVEELTGGIAFLFKKNKVEHVIGAGAITAAGTVEVAQKGGKKRVLKADNIIIATGSEVSPLPGVTIDGKRVITSTEALSLPKVPKHMVVIGGGVIGLELGSVWRRLGAALTVVEYMPVLLPGMDGEVSKTMARILKKQGMKIKLSTKVTGVEITKSGASVTVEPAAGGDGETIKCDSVLVSVGRRPFTEGLGLEAVGITLNETGRIPVDENFATSAAGIYAIGDVIDGPMLAHKAEDEGYACASNLAGQTGQVNHDVIPSVVYTMPEVAVVGKTEEELKDKDISYKEGRYLYKNTGMGLAFMDEDSFVKVLVGEDDSILGAHIVGPEASTLIHEVALAMANGLKAKAFRELIVAHPALSEVVQRAFLKVS
ncbi:MAG: dihydrolipoyl dehydrogenase [Proteobacteria bacterium]|nr:dihydrolipoyl dehydrogenase [Pseudomonadota bacterium]